MDLVVRPGSHWQYKPKVLEGFSGAGFNALESC